MKLIKPAKLVLKAKLEALGIIDDDLLIVSMRKSRSGNIGYYSTKSQFRGKARIVVDSKFIRDQYMYESDAQEEVLKTIVVLYAHIIVELIDCLTENQQGNPDKFKVPDWRITFNGDISEFSEDLGRYLVTFDAKNEDFWEVFLYHYAAEFNRLVTEAGN